MYMKAVQNQENTDRGTVMGLYWESNTGKNPCQALGWGKPSEHKLLDLIQMAGIPTEPRGGKTRLHHRECCCPWQIPPVSSPQHSAAAFEVKTYKS